MTTIDKIELARAHLATCMERDDFPSHNCACNCSDVSELLAAIASYEEGITWDTTCLDHAHNLDQAYARHLELENERDEARAEVARLRAVMRLGETVMNGLAAGCNNDFTLIADGSGETISDRWFRLRDEFRIALGPEHA